VASKISFFSIHTWRLIFRRLIYSFHRDGLFQIEAVIVGSNAEAGILANQLLYTKTDNLRINGYLNCGNRAPILTEELSCLGTIDDLESVIHDYHIQVVILVISSLTKEQIASIYRRFGSSSEVELRISSSPAVRTNTGSLQVNAKVQGPLTIRKARLTRMDKTFKTILDYCLTIPTIILLAPVFAIIAIAIKLDSPGPVIEACKMMGFHGKIFTLYSFRMRYTNTAAQITAEQPGASDTEPDRKSGLTRSGHFLCATRLDFLPRLINVLHNDMSLVGTRMVCPNEFAGSDTDKINLLSIQPGITGIWHLKGCPKISLNEQVSYDMYYIQNWTIWKDLKIIFQSILFAPRIA
jgi:lipopolysaccharide/colanic/teichoic acid biosynthesis glycosyltransferase